MRKADRFERALRLIAATTFKNKMANGGACIPAALTVRDFLRELGFQAETKSVALRITALRPGELPRQIFVGGRDLCGADSGPGWDGHLIVTARGLLIDPSFGQCRRPWWSFVPDVAITGLIHPRFRQRVVTDDGKAMPVIARLAHKDDKIDFETIWAATPSNAGWKLAPAAKPDRWRPMVDDMLAEFRREVVS